MESPSAGRSGRLCCQATAPPRQMWGNLGSPPLDDSEAIDRVFARHCRPQPSASSSTTNFGFLDSLRASPYLCLAFSTLFLEC